MMSGSIIISKDRYEFSSNGLIFSPVWGIFQTFIRVTDNNWSQDQKFLGKVLPEFTLVSGWFSDLFWRAEVSTQKGSSTYS